MQTTNLLLMSCLLAASAAVPANTDLPRRTLELRPGPGNPRNSEGAFATLADGRLLYVYTRFNGNHGEDHGSAELAARYSSDHGETWTASDRIIVANEGGQNVMSVSLLRLNDNRLALFYLRKNSNFDCRPVLRYSSDEGESWTAPVECIPDDIGYYVLNNDRVVQLDSGRLVLPLALHARQGDAATDFAGTILCQLSDNNGATWRHSRQEFKLHAPDGKRITAQEPGVVQLKDGRLMMFIRTDAGCQMTCFSADGGDTWTTPQLSDILSPLSPASIKRLPTTGDLLLVWNNHRGLPENFNDQRVPLALAVSQDDGASWTNVKTLEGCPWGWFCYIAIHFTGDDILLGYCAMANLSHSRITKVPVKWLYDGPSSPAPSYHASLFDNLPDGPFTQLTTPRGTWTAPEGHAELFSYDRGRGVRLKGGLNQTVTFTLDTPDTLHNLPFKIERFTALPPYALAVEAEVNGEWLLVAAQDHNTPVGNPLFLPTAADRTTVTRLRFRCSSARGAIIADVPPVDLHGFFND